MDKVQESAFTNSLVFGENSLHIQRLKKKYVGDTTIIYRQLLEGEINGRMYKQRELESHVANMH
jgi:hypothetical protein